ncbi:MAG: hypothetical protein AB8G18_11620 [Gammaproteobacteria bacterium]
MSNQCPEHELSELAQQFLASNLDAAAFGHTEHLCVAYDLLHHYDFLTATAHYVEGIKTLAASVGADDKFNMPITVAWLSVIAEKIAVTHAVSCDEFLQQNPDLFSKDLLGSRYSQERLDSALARKQFLLPDLI